MAEDCTNEWWINPCPWIMECNRPANNANEIIYTNSVRMTRGNNDTCITCTMNTEYENCSGGRCGVRPREYEIFCTVSKCRLFYFKLNLPTKILDSIVVVGNRVNSKWCLDSQCQWDIRPQKFHRSQLGIEKSVREGNHNMYIYSLHIEFERNIILLVDSIVLARECTK